jgi:hypothetical protein
VPFYPVFGNHEQNTDYYIRYFHLPDNGSDGYEEHWYYTDYSNLRVIGLDSNGGYQVQEQLDWLEYVLIDACENDNIDFVFAQLHHPFKSELWTPGESNYTGDVIERMEDFSDECGKPSIHFFGHTHGYSRGQSQDHNHLWVNVATAGGAIDYWGEWPQADYEEFTVTQDEWGFVVVDVEAGEDPKFELKRSSRGNEDVSRDNEIRDNIVIRFNNIVPEQPIGYLLEDEQDPYNIILTASEFTDTDGDEPISVSVNSDAVKIILYGSCSSSNKYPIGCSGTILLNLITILSLISLSLDTSSLPLLLLLSSNLGSSPASTSTTTKPHSSWVTVNSS